MTLINCSEVFQMPIQSRLRRIAEP
jgi:hypothetical protein